jgi:hypothetical protein
MRRYDAAFKQLLFYKEGAFRDYEKPTGLPARAALLVSVFD